VELLQELAERMAIIELIARYADRADHKDWQAMTAMYTDDAVFDGQDVYGRTWTGHEEILDFYEKAPLAVAHHPTGVYSDFSNDSEAKTRLKMLVLFRSAMFTVDYDFELLKVGTDWRIRRLQITVVGRNDLPR
jgi:hypothetical protein